MPYTPIDDADISIHRDDADLLVVWSSSSPEGTVFQLYLDGELVWFGTDRRARVPYDGSARRRIDVGEVDDDEATEDFGDDLSDPGGAGDVVTLTWRGGTYLDDSGLDDVIGFRVYRGTAPGGAVDYSTPVADIPAYGSTTPLDGFGLGGFGQGGFGRSSSDYSWTSDPLAAGDWDFAIVPYDAAGNEGTGSTTTATSEAPPRPPAADSATGLRLSYSYNSSTHVPTLTWTASPS